MIYSKKILPRALIFSLLVFAVSCKKDSPSTLQSSSAATSSADYSTLLKFSGSSSSSAGKVYEILPGPAVINPAMNPTPFSNNIKMASGSYNLVVADNSKVDSPNSTDAVTSVDIEFTANNGKRFKIDKINIIHKPEGAGDHTFFGCVGLNKMMHVNTGIGTKLMRKMLAYITLWGLVDLKDAVTGKIVASNRIVHIMVGSRVRTKDLKLITDVDTDKSNHDTWMAKTHVILIPQDMAGNKSPVPGTDHGFIHMMWENVNLTDATRDWKKAYEILPGPAAINATMSPTPFSNNVAFGSGSYTFEAVDNSPDDSKTSTDLVKNVSIKYQRPDGEMFVIDNIKIIHKAPGTGDHSYFGGVGFNKEMHGNTGIGTDLVPKMLAYVTLWGTADLKDGSGNILVSDRVIHIMVASQARTADLNLITDVNTDGTDYAKNEYETHIILPNSRPMDY